MKRQVIASRTFTQADQDCFADLSGDHNPMHVDAVAARRAFFGEQVVHGLHLVIWSLESALAHWNTQQQTPPVFQSLTARFLKPAFLGEVVEVCLREEPPEKVVLQVVLHETTLAEMVLSGLQAAAPPAPGGLANGAFGKAPRNLTMGEMLGLKGAVSLAYEPEALRRTFPGASVWLGPARLARLLSLSRLVGMECPGLYSLFSAFEVTFGPGLEEAALPYAVTRAEPKFSRVRIALTGGGLRGHVDAFVRPAPRPSPTTADLARRVEPGEFRGRRPLVVGGSRGLGEIMARALAHGGADVLLTYHRGLAEAEQVVQSIRQAGGQGNLLHLDVADPESALASCTSLRWRPTDLYYFATPRISRRKAGFFDGQLFQRFADCYLEGFSRTVLACRRLADGMLRVFYPSSVYVAGNPGDFAEYAAAKAAGESLCQSIQRSVPDTRVLAERLPPLPTDQTASLIEAPAGDALGVLGQIARKMQHLK